MQRDFSVFICTFALIMKYDIFISYKRKSLPTANNLYYRLTTRGYSTFFDLEEMGRDNFKGVNSFTGETKVFNESIDAIEEKSVQITWSHSSKIKDVWHKSRKGCCITISIGL